MGLSTYPNCGSPNPNVCYTQSSKKTNNKITVIIFLFIIVILWIIFSNRAHNNSKPVSNIEEAKEEIKSSQITTNYYESIDDTEY